MFIHSKAANDVLAERERQVTGEGWTAEHDDDHKAGEMALAACCYASPNLLYVMDNRANAVIFKDPWPWDEHWDKRGYNGNSTMANKSLSAGKRRDLLVKAGALIIAEIERLDRMKK